MIVQYVSAGLPPCLNHRSILEKLPSVRGMYWRTVYSPRCDSKKASLVPLESCIFGTRSSSPERRKTSDSTLSSYRGSPFDVLRVIAGIETPQPSPNGLLPLPESYESD